MKRLIPLVSLIFFLVSGLQATDSTLVRSIFDDFYRPDQTVEVTLQFDCQQFIRTKQKQEEHPATITYQRSNGEMITRDIKIVSRGKLRLEICGFPPIKLEFDKKELAADSFSLAVDDVKLVTHCHNSNRTDQLVTKEYLAYQLYNMVEAYSYRTQLLHIKYLDKDSTLYTENKAFMIEPTDAMAARLGCRESEKHIQTESELQADAYANMLLFEYMIGNVDWSIPLLHNVKLIRSVTGGAGYIPVPYDFDFSGLVGASYAAPQERVNQKYVGQRMLLGEFLSEASFQTSLQKFLNAKEQMLLACSQGVPLEEKEQEKIIKYLNVFFSRIEKRNMSPDKL